MSTSLQLSCDSMPRPGVREGVRVGTGQCSRTATPDTLTEEREIERRGGEKEEQEENMRGVQSMTQPCRSNLYFHNFFKYNFYFGL